MYIGNLSWIIFFIFFGVKDVELVINGRKAELGDFPYIASLQHVFLGHECGAVIISSKFLLSAAHCFDHEDVSNWIIKMGVVSLDDESAKIFQVRKFHIRDDYRPAVTKKLTVKEKLAMIARGKRLYSDIMTIEEAKHDIAVVEAKRYFSFNLLGLPLPESQELSEELEDLRIAKIRRSEERPEPCAICMFAGWGSSVEGPPGPVMKNLMYLMIKVHNDEDCCRQSCKHEPDLICAQNPARNAAPSFGDSGGPLICNGYLAGIISHGEPYSDEVAHYVDVVHYKDWIDGIITLKSLGKRELSEL